MTYKNKADLSDYLRNSMPEDAQELYIKVYNKSWKEYDEDEILGKQSREAVAHRDGWAAVNREFVHDEENGVWYRRGEEPAETEEDETILDRLNKFT